MKTKATRYKVKTEKKNRVFIEEIQQDDIKEFWNKLGELEHAL